MPNQSQPKSLQGRLEEATAQSSQQTQLTLQQRLIELEEHHEDTKFEPKKSDEKAWIERSGFLFWKKDVIYAGTPANKTLVLDCDKYNLIGVSNPALSPDGQRIVFVASSEDKESKNNLYVVSRNGEDLQEITHKGEGQHQKENQLTWTHPFRFRYFVPPYTKQTFDYKCKDQPHVHEVRLTEENFPCRVVNFYFEDGKLVEETFTAPEIQGAISDFEETLNKYIEAYKRFYKQLKQRLEQVENKKFKGFEDTFIQKTEIRVLKLWLGVAEEYADVHADMLKNVKKIKEDRIANIRTYIGSGEYFFELSKHTVNGLCES